MINLYDRNFFIQTLKTSIYRKNNFFQYLTIIIIPETIWRGKSHYEGGGFIVTPQPPQKNGYVVRLPRGGNLNVYSHHGHSSEGKSHYIGNLQGKGGSLFSQPSRGSFTMGEVSQYNTNWKLNASAFSHQRI